MHPDTLAIHVGQEPDPVSGAVVPPIVLSSTFVNTAAHQYEYGRTNNPNRQGLECCVAALEGARHGIAFASGCAAMDAVLRSLGPGDHVVACADVYGGTYRLLDQVFCNVGVTVSWVDMSSTQAVSDACTGQTRLVLMETPTNPTLKIFDISAVAQVAHDAAALLVVDNTFATPLLQRPLELGADIVVHSVTKYINGHSDVVGGLVLTSHEAVAKRLRHLQNAAGAVPSPFDCYLVTRGLRTLSVRMARHCDNALAVARALSDNGRASCVHYPGLPDHPQHALARQQMQGGFGGVIAFEVPGGSHGAQRFLAALKLIRAAGSLGGVESLAEHPATLSHASIPAADRERLGISEGLVRLSVGLEAPEDLLADIEQALPAAD